MISKTEEYALRAAVHLAQRYEEGPCRAQDIAGGSHIPANYLSKILHRLAHAGIVTSERGRYGGFRLARRPSELTLADVMEPFGSLSERGRCLLGRPECSDLNPCGAHWRWKRVKAATLAFFRETTLADVVRPGAEDPGQDLAAHTVSGGP